MPMPRPMARAAFTVWAWTTPTARPMPVEVVSARPVVCERDTVCAPPSLVVTERERVCPSAVVSVVVVEDMRAWLSPVVVACMVAVPVPWATVWDVVSAVVWVVADVWVVPWATPQPWDWVVLWKPPCIDVSVVPQAWPPLTPTSNTPGMPPPTLPPTFQLLVFATDVPQDVPLDVAVPQFSERTVVWATPLVTPTPTVRAVPSETDWKVLWDTPVVVACMVAWVSPVVRAVPRVTTLLHASPSVTARPHVSVSAVPTVSASETVWARPSV